MQTARQGITVRAISRSLAWDVTRAIFQLFFSLRPVFIFLLFIFRLFSDVLYSTSTNPTPAILRGSSALSRSRKREQPRGWNDRWISRLSSQSRGLCLLTACELISNTSPDSRFFRERARVGWIYLRRWILLGLMTGAPHFVMWIIGVFTEGQHLCFYSLVPFAQLLLFRFDHFLCRISFSTLFCYHYDYQFLLFLLFWP